MIIRQLTAAEKATAQKARNEANTRIKVWRTKRMMELQSKYARKADREQAAIKDLPLMTGVPTKVTDGEHTMIVDFEPLSQFCRSLRSPNWSVSARMSAGRGRVELSLTYTNRVDGRHGWMTLRGMPAKHVEALEGSELPTVQAFG